MEGLYLPVSLWVEVVVLLWVNRSSLKILWWGRERQWVWWWVGGQIAVCSLSLCLMRWCVAEWVCPVLSLECCWVCPHHRLSALRRWSVLWLSECRGKHGAFRTLKEMCKWMSVGWSPVLSPECCCCFCPHHLSSALRWSVLWLSDRCGKHGAHFCEGSHSCGDPGGLSRILFLTLLGPLVTRWALLAVAQVMVVASLNTSQPGTQTKKVEVLDLPDVLYFFMSTMWKCS